MRGFQSVTVCGHLGRDPEIRTFDDGGKIATLSVATTEQWNDRQSGERKERTEWHRVVLRNGVAGVAERYLGKGDAVLVNGKLQTRKWQDQNGQDRYTTEIVVAGAGGTMQMLGGSGRGSDGGEQGVGGQEAPVDEPPF